MKQSETESPKYKRPGRKRFELSPVLHRTPFVAGGLVCSAVLVGILFYVQAGLLMDNPPPPESRGQITEDMARQEEQQASPKQTVLESQSTVEVNPEPKANPGTAGGRDARTNCDGASASAAKQVYEKSLSAEKELHQQKLRKISRFWNMLLGRLDDKKEEENARHAQAVSDIEAKYRKALAAHCQ